MEFFISDTHFGHENVVWMCERPFSSVEEMNEALIANWNSRVKGNDKVYIMGDMFFRADIKLVEAILSRLKGRKILIVGNHDGSWTSKLDHPERHFESIQPFYEGSVGNRGVTMCHYPLFAYRHQKKQYMIHGHIHNDTSTDYWPLLKVRPLVLNAGVDINGFRPVTFEELIENNRIWKENH